MYSLKDAAVLYPIRQHWLVLCFISGCAHLRWHTAVLYYDYALTFGMEVEYIWNSRFRASTMLYIWCRYALVANVIYLLNISKKLDIRVTSKHFN